MSHRAFAVYLVRHKLQNWKWLKRSFNLRARSKQTFFNDLISRDIFVWLADLLRAKATQNARSCVVQWTWSVPNENLILGEFVIARAPTKVKQNEDFWPISNDFTPWVSDGSSSQIEFDLWKFMDLDRVEGTWKCFNFSARGSPIHAWRHTRSGHKTEPIEIGFNWRWNFASFGENFPWTWSFWRTNCDVILSISSVVLSHFRDFLRDELENSHQITKSSSTRSENRITAVCYYLVWTRVAGQTVLLTWAPIIF